MNSSLSFALFHRQKVSFAHAIAVTDIETQADNKKWIEVSKGIEASK